jgi:hypothetical protein
VSLSLTEKIVRLHKALDESELPHAFGGALALAYCTADPRATHDIDVNVFVRPDHVDEVLAALPRGVVAGEDDRRLLSRDGQARLWWDGTPIDVFLSYHPFHDQAQERSRRLPFGKLSDLPVLSCRDLAVFKAFFSRPKDAVDLATMAADGQLEVAAVLADVSELLGADSSNLEFVRRSLEQGAQGA